MENGSRKGSAGREGRVWTNRQAGGCSGQTRSDDQAAEGERSCDAGMSQLRDG